MGRPLRFPAALGLYSPHIDLRFCWRQTFRLQSVFSYLLINFTSTKQGQKKEIKGETEDEGEMEREIAMMGETQSEGTEQNSVIMSSCPSIALLR